MKKLTIYLTIIAMVFLAGCAALVKSDAEPAATIAEVVAIPLTGEYAIEESMVLGKFKVVQVENWVVAMKIPMPDPAAAKLDDIVIFASVAWTDGKKWHLVSSDDYSRFVSLPEIADDGTRKIQLQLPKKGNGWFWLRIWGQNKADQSWLWIKKEDPYLRLDTGGNPGYEAIVNARGEFKPVPQEYNSRQ